MASRKKAIISGLQTKLVQEKKKELNPGKFEEVLIHKFLLSQSFNDFSLDLCRVSINIGRQDTLTDVQKMYLEIKIKKEEL